jgi:hypothetical protein
MPRFDLQLSVVAQTAIAIAKAGELAHAAADSAVRKEWTVTKLESLYELAYLRVFAAWESCLEGIFYRSLCGYASTVGQEALVTGTYYSSLHAAETAIAGTRYLLWHNPTKVIQRCRRHIRAGRQENTINSNLTRLEHLSYARHRVVHDQADAKQKFDTATISIVGRTYPASRPGKFLRDWDTSSPTPRRWLDTLAQELTVLVRQMI